MVQPILLEPVVPPSWDVTSRGRRTRHGDFGMVLTTSRTSRAREANAMILYNRSRRDVTTPYSRPHPHHVAADHRFAGGEPDDVRGDGFPSAHVLALVSVPVVAGDDAGVDVVEQPAQGVPVEPERGGAGRERSSQVVRRRARSSTN